MRVFQTDHRSHELQLHVERQACRDAVWVKLVRRETFGFEKDLVRILGRKSVNLVLDRWTVARPNALDHSRVHRRPIQPGTDDVVCSGVRMRYPARHLPRMLLDATQKRENRDRIQVARLFFELRIIDRPPVDTRWRARLEPALRQFQFFQTARKRNSRRIAGPATRVVVQPNVNFSVEERPRGQHHGTRAKTDANLRNRADNTLALDDQIVDRLLKQPQIRLVLQPMSDRLFVEQAISLRPRGTHSRPFGRVQNPELNATFIGCSRHGAAQRIHFLDEMTFANAANRWIAAHLTERLDIVRK